jgi:hypothetical protein
VSTLKSKNTRLTSIKLSTLLIIIITSVSQMGGFCVCCPGTGAQATPTPTPNTGGILPSPIFKTADLLTVATNSYYFQANYYAQQPKQFMVFPYSDNTGTISKDNISYSFSSIRTDTVLPSSQSLSGGQQTFDIVFNSVDNMSPTVDLTVTGVDPTSGMNTSASINPYLWFPKITSTAEDDNSGLPGGSLQYSSSDTANYCTYEDLDNFGTGWHFVALPSSDVDYGAQVLVRTSTNNGNGTGNTIQATNWDCGPWFCDNDNCDPVGDGSGDAYWVLGQRPRTEYLIANNLDECRGDTSPPGNEAGIDMSKQLCLDLANGSYSEDASGVCQANGPAQVDWRFTTGSQDLYCQ